MSSKDGRHATPAVAGLAGFVRAVRGQTRAASPPCRKGCSPCPLYRPVELLASFPATRSPAPTRVLPLDRFPCQKMFVTSRGIRSVDPIPVGRLTEVARAVARCPVRSSGQTVFLSLDPQ